jgi:S1-C subfamily serine protease
MLAQTMIPHIRAVSLGVLSLLLATQPAAADMIRFKDGTTMRGTVTKRSPTEIIVEFDFGTMSFAPGDIVAVEAEPTPEPAAEAEPMPELEPAAQQLDAPAAQEPLSATEGQAETPSGERQPEAVLLAEPPAPEQTVEQVGNTIAFIGVAFEDGTLGIGSGTVINDRGTMVTNYHVVANAERIGVVLPGIGGKGRSKNQRPYLARVLKVDKCFDLALLQIPIKTPDYLRFAGDDDIEVGHPVRAVGNPEGLTVSFSKGIVSAVRSVEEMGVDEAVRALAMECQHLSGRALREFTLVQTDASINPGNSGGPLLDAENEIVGINSLMAGVGLNFAIHVKHVRKFVGTYAKR